MKRIALRRPDVVIKTNETFSVYRGLISRTVTDFLFSGLTRRTCDTKFFFPKFGQIVLTTQKKQQLRVHFILCTICRENYTCTKDRKPQI